MIRNNSEENLDMKKVNKVVQRIKSHYAGNDCVQVMAAYKDNLTILSKDGISYYQEKNTDFYINKYLNDDRRYRFPYSNIPTHDENIGFFNRYHFTNQLLNYQQPYIRIGDGIIIESYAIKENDEAFLINELLEADKDTAIMTREEVDEIFEESKDDEGKKYILDLNGVIDFNKEGIASEEKIYQDIKQSLLNNIKDLKEYISLNYDSVVGSYLNKNPLFLKYVAESLNIIDLNSIRFNVPILNFNSNNMTVIVKIKDNNIKIEVVKIYFMESNLYKVDTYRLPITKYTLDELKNVTSKVINTKEPKIPLSLNPNISKEDVKEAKRLIRK